MNGPDLPPPGSLPPYPGSSQPQSSNPPPQPPPYHAPEGGSVPPPQPNPSGGKKTPWPWILGGCGGCLVLLIIAGVVIAAITFTTRKTLRQHRIAAPMRVQEGMIPFTNELFNIPEGLKQHYSRFSFQYPAHFSIVPDESNFVKVEEAEDGFTLENFAVGYMSVDAGVSNEQAYPQLMSQLSQQIGQGFQEYRELSQFPATVGGVRGRGMRWQATARNTPKGDVQFFGYVILARKEVRPKGVAIIMIATNLDDEVQSPEDVGTRGDVARILETFRLE
jgi:hypothetical protein